MSKLNSTDLFCAAQNMPIQLFVLWNPLVTYILTHYFNIITVNDVPQIIGLLS